jgi:transposase InsO family protein
MFQGFVYLVAIIDWYSRYILSWRVSISLEGEFCVAALEEAMEKYGKPEIFNTDRVLTLESSIKKQKGILFTKICVIFTFIPPIILPS